MKKYIFLILILISRTALCEQIYERHIFTIYNDYPVLTFEIFNPADDLLKFAFIRKPYNFSSSDNSFKINCDSSSCKIKISLTSKENFDAKIPFTEQAFSKSTCSELVKKFKPATYLFENGNLELGLSDRSCFLSYLNLDNYSNQKIDTTLKKFLEYKKTESDKIKNFSGSINDISWVKNKLQVLVNIDQKARSLLSYPEQNKLKLTDNIYFKKTLRKRLYVDTEHTSELKELLNKYNWFVISKFGKQADHNGWLLIQHQDHDRKFQKMVLKRLEKLYPLGETSKKNYAYLYDRVKVSEGKPQKYGIKQLFFCKYV